MSAGTAGWNFDVTKFGTRTGDIWAPTADGNDSITVENNAITPTDATIDSLSTKTSNGRTTYVDYNVATSEDQNAGIYSDTLVYTATADSATSSPMTISPSTINTGSAANITATTPLYTTDDHANTTFYLLTEEQYAEVKSGTPVSEVGGTTLTATRTSSTPVTYNVSIPAQQDEGAFHVYADIADFTEDFEAKIVVETPPYIQDQTYINQCKNAAVGTTLTLTDSRDGNEYKVRKLADGNCWMVENLRLNGPIPAADLNSTNTNVAAGSTFALTASDSGTWCTSYRADCDNQSMTLDTGNSTYGTYYNWYAATAGTGTYETKAKVNASSSICPRGWRLPTGGDSGEFQTLYNQYPSAANMLDANGPAFVLSGERYGDRTDNQGSGGYYWSSTAYNYNYAYDLWLDRYVGPAGNYQRYNGQTVRCIAQ